MTTTTKIFRAGSVVIWPDQEGDSPSFEHALAVQPYDDCIVIEQNGNTVNVPRYALPALLKALREMKQGKS